MNSVANELDAQAREQACSALVQGEHTMHKSIYCAIAAVTLAVPAAAFTIDLEGQEVDGAMFNVFTVTAPDIGEVSRIEFSFVYEAGLDTGSWGSELVVQIGHLPSDEFVQIGTQDVGCSDFGIFCEFDLMWDDDVGTFTATGGINLNSNAIADGSGDWEILFADSFDDDGIDGRFLEGSFIELTEIPLPAAAWLMGSALLGLGAAARRRAG